jgi:hypothetical protein
MLAVVIAAVLSNSMGQMISRELYQPFPNSVHGTLVERYLFGFPMVWGQVGTFQGCTTGVHVEFEGMWLGVVFDLWFWLSALVIISMIPEDKK